MLIYNLERIYRARGIDKPFAFFRAAGFSESYSAKLKNGMVTGMKLATLEKLCEILHCTPHDVLEWRADNGSMITKDHPLRILESKNKPPDMTTLMKTIPLDKLKEFEQLVKNESKLDDQ